MINKTVKELYKKELTKYSKQLPTRKIVIHHTVNIEILKKLVLLSNHYVQYYGTSYEEAIMVINGENIIYYEPKDGIDCPHDIKELNRFILECCNQPSISKVNMQTANKMWKNLKRYAARTKAKVKAKNDRQKANGK